MLSTVEVDADEAKEELETKRPVAKRDPLTPPARRRDDLVTNMLGTMRSRLLDKKYLKNDG